ncbi:TSC1 [Lepeophtheirus salmonis]|uniref:TSC1 n=1 Tax=Lepeophtheirus salmonis TaxID=72036 RepID=A0A7R8DAD3_LEPSM|nr:TSC1 [Lepeophtheirus salmonis]CAF3025469.1 TSC1 [Lepeophtheirus salmonis]
MNIVESGVDDEGGLFEKEECNELSDNLRRCLDAQGTWIDRGGKWKWMRFFSHLESDHCEVVQEVRQVIYDQFAEVKEPWLINGLYDYCCSIAGRVCSRHPCLELILGVREPHDKFLSDRLTESLIRGSSEQKVEALLILGHLIRKSPSWLYKITQMPLLKELFRLLRTENEIQILLTALLDLICLLPAIPSYITPFIQDLFEIFSHLTAWRHHHLHNLHPVHQIHLQSILLSYFHRLYGMFPCNFLHFLRSHYANQTAFFKSSIQPMLVTVRLHPLLVSHSREQEKSLSRWKRMELHDVLTESSRYALIPQEFNNEDVLEEASLLLPEPLSSAVPSHVTPLDESWACSISSENTETAIEATPETTPFVTPSKDIVDEETTKVVGTEEPAMNYLSAHPDYWRNGVDKHNPIEEIDSAFDTSLFQSSSCIQSSNENLFDFAKKVHGNCTNDLGESLNERRRKRYHSCPDPSKLTQMNMKILFKDQQYLDYSAFTYEHLFPCISTIGNCHLERKEVENPYLLLDKYLESACDSTQKEHREDVYKSKSKSSRILKEENTALRDQLQLVKSEIDDLHRQIEEIRREKHLIEEERSFTARNRDHEIEKRSAEIRSLKISAQKSEEIIDELNHAVVEGRKELDTSRAQFFLMKAECEELVMMGELQSKYKERLDNPANNMESETMNLFKQAYERDLQTMARALENKTFEVETFKCRITELDSLLSKKNAQILDHKKLIKRIQDEKTMRFYESPNLHMNLWCNYISKRRVMSPRPSGGLLDFHATRNVDIEQQPETFSSSDRSFVVGSPPLSSGGSIGSDKSEVMRRALESTRPIKFGEEDSSTLAGSSSSCVKDSFEHHSSIHPGYKNIYTYRDMSNFTKPSPNVTIHRIIPSNHKESSHPSEEDCVSDTSSATSYNLLVERCPEVLVDAFNKTIGLDDLELSSDEDSSNLRKKIIPDINLTYERLISINMRELNILLKDLSKKRRMEIKNIRRTLKNRGYAADSRTRRLIENDEIEKEIQLMNKKKKQVSEEINANKFRLNVIIESCEKILHSIDKYDKAEELKAEVKATVMKECPFTDKEMEKTFLSLAT